MIKKKDGSSFSIPKHDINNDAISYCAIRVGYNIIYLN